MASIVTLCQQSPHSSLLDVTFAAMLRGTLHILIDLQTHPYVRILIKVILGAIAVTLAFQSQLYARWLQFVGAAIAGTAVAAYGLSKDSLDPSGQMLGSKLLLDDPLVLFSTLCYDCS